MPAYVPPALRGVAGQQADAQPRLFERVWRIKLEYSTGGPFDVAECPEELLPINVADQLPEVTVRHLELPSEASAGELKALLNWFAKSSALTSEPHPHGDARCQLLFPPALSKDTRKLLHQMAQGLGLPTFSKGLGDDRRLAVHGAGFRDTPEMEAEVAAVAARRKAPGPLRDRAKQIWRWCQADGGALWAISQGELEEALMAAPDEGALPGPVKDLLERRVHGTALINAIRAQDSAAALAVLAAHPRAAWIRDDGPAPAPGGNGGAGGGGGGSQGGAASGGIQGGADAGYYPLHLAALAGLGDVVECLANQPGAVEQRDRNYATPLKVAKKAGHTAMVELLLKHGAKDYEINQAAHKTTAVGIPLPPGAGHARRVSGGTSSSLGQSMGASPRMGSPATGSSPHAVGSYMAAHAAGRQRRMSNDGPSPSHRPGAQHGGSQHGGGGAQHAQHGGQQGGGAHHGPHHGHHGPSTLGGGHRGSAPGIAGGSTCRRSIDEHPPPSQPHTATASGAAAAADPTINPFALLAGNNRSGGSSRRSSAGGGSGGGALPACRQGAAAAADANGGTSDSDSSTGGAGCGGVSRVMGRARVPGSWIPLPPIQSGEVSESSVAAALAGLGLSAKPELPTAAEGTEAVEEEAAGAAGSGDDDAGSANGAADDGAPRKRKTRRGRRGRGNRRQSIASTDEGVTAAAVTSAVAAKGAVSIPDAAAGGGGSSGGGCPASAPAGPSGSQLLKEFMSYGSAGTGSHGGDSSDRSVTDGSESDGSAGGGSRTRRGGQPARARRHERRRAARVSAGDGGDGRPERNRRGSAAEYSSFHQGHGYGHGHGHGHVHGNRGGNHQQGGHYHVYGGAHQGHADDATSWRRDAAVATAVAAAGAPAEGSSTASPMRGAGGPDEPRQPAGAGRPPAPRRASAGPGLPPHPPGPHGGASGGGAATSGGGAGPGDAPGSPFHLLGGHGPREHVAQGPAGGTGFGFGRGRGRGLAPGAPGRGPPSAPGSPLRPANATPPPSGPGAAGAPPAPGSAATGAAHGPSGLSLSSSDVAPPPARP